MKTCWWTCGVVGGPVKKEKKVFLCYSSARQSGSEIWFRIVHPVSDSSICFYD